MDDLFPYVVNLVAGIILIVIFYKIIKGIINFFKGIAWDVKNTTERVKEKKERAANIPIIVEDIIKSIESYCGNWDLIDSINVGSGNPDILIKLKDGKQLNYSSYQHGFDVRNHEPIAKALASRLNFSIEPMVEENVSDQGYHICGYKLLSDYALKRQQEIMEKRNNRIKV